MIRSRRCEICGFAREEYDHQDTLGTLRSFDARWRWTLEGIGRGQIDGLPEPAVNRSPDEFADERSLLAAAHQGTHRLVLAGRARARMPAAAGTLAVAGGRSPAGSVVAVNISDGGAPKRPVGRVKVGRSGLESDRQAERRHHGRPWQAVSLWSREVIEALTAEGHPIGPGCAGENLTISGLDWAKMRPGVRLGLGADVVVEMTAYAEPCPKIAGCFVGRDFNRIDHDRQPGVSRLYGSVLRTGEIAPGDPVIVEPARLHLPATDGQQRSGALRCAGGAV